MEGISTIEKLGEWRSKKDNAPAEARELIGQIVGYETMSLNEKVAALNALLHELAEDNQNRYVAEAVAVQLSILKENERHAVRKLELEAVS